MTDSRLIEIPEFNTFYHRPKFVPPWWLAERYYRFAFSRHPHLRFAAVGLVVRHLRPDPSPVAIEQRGRTWCMSVQNRHLGELGRAAAREVAELRELVRVLEKRDKLESEMVVLAERREYLAAACYVLNQRGACAFLYPDLEKLDREARRVLKSRDSTAPHSPLLASVFELDQDLWWGRLTYVRTTSARAKTR